MKFKISILFIISIEVAYQHITAVVEVGTDLAWVVAYLVVPSLAAVVDTVLASWAAMDSHLVPCLVAASLAVKVGIVVAMDIRPLVVVDIHPLVAVGIHPLVVEDIHPLVVVVGTMATGDNHPFTIVDILALVAVVEDIATVDIAVVVGTVVVCTMLVHTLVVEVDRLVVECRKLVRILVVHCYDVVG